MLKQVDGGVRVMDVDQELAEPVRFMRKFGLGMGQLGLEPAESGIVVESTHLASSRMKSTADDTSEAIAKRHGFTAAPIGPMKHNPLHPTVPDKGIQAAKQKPPPVDPGPRLDMMLARTVDLLRNSPQFTATPFCRYGQTLLTVMGGRAYRILTI